MRNTKFLKQHDENFNMGYSLGGIVYGRYMFYKLLEEFLETHKPLAEMPESLYGLLIGLSEGYTTGPIRRIIKKYIKHGLPCKHAVVKVPYGHNGYSYDKYTFAIDEDALVLR